VKKEVMQEPQQPRSFLWLPPDEEGADGEGEGVGTAGEEGEAGASGDIGTPSQWPEDAPG
jgi:hypothetical protein